jgi:hypothetical protein
MVPEGMLACMNKIGGIGRRGAGVAAIAAAGFFGACGHPVQRAPALSAPAEAPATPAKKPFIDRAADATWHVVSAPVRWAIPAKKPEPPQQPEHTYSVDAFIMTPGGAPWQPPTQAGPSTQQAATQPR